MLRWTDEILPDTAILVGYSSIAKREQRRGRGRSFIKENISVKIRENGVKSKQPQGDRPSTQTQNLPWTDYNIAHSDEIEQPDMQLLTKCIDVINVTVTEPYA